MVEVDEDEEGVVRFTPRLGGNDKEFIFFLGCAKSLFNSKLVREEVIALNYHKTYACCFGHNFVNNLVVDHIVVVVVVVDHIVAVDLANGSVDVVVAGRIDCTVVDRTVVEVLDCKNWRRISLIGHQSIAVDC